MHRNPLTGIPGIFGFQLIRRSARRYPVLTRTAAQAAVIKAVLSQVPLFRTRVERRLPALSSLRGHRPAPDTRWPASGKRVMFTPISATSPERGGH